MLKLQLFLLYASTVLAQSPIVFEVDSLGFSPFTPQYRMVGSTIINLESAVDCLEDQSIASQMGTWFPGLKRQNSE